MQVARLLTQALTMSLCTVPISAIAQQHAELEEIIVTATKTRESLQDASMSITALSTRDIERRRLVSMSDYLNTVPGVAQQDFGVGRNQIVMRGVGSSLFEEATVGVYLDEAPLTAIAEGAALDLKLVDMERVEVLRGPQGTLYGAASMGGSVRNITISPNLSEWGGKVDVGYSNTADTGGSNYSAVGVVNIPLVQDTLAVRVVGYYYDNEGYIQNVGASTPAVASFANLIGGTALDRDHVGGSQYAGMRVHALWQATDALSLKLTYANQELESDGFNEVDISLPQGGYTSAPLEVGGPEGGEFFTDDIELANLLVNWNLGVAELVSSTTWFGGPRGEARDVSRDARLPTFALNFVGTADRDALIQEVRVASKFDGPLNVLGGLYYEDLDRRNLTDALWIGAPARNPFPGVILHRDATFRIRHYAVFGEVSYKLTEKLKATVGGRWFDYEREQDRFESGAFAGAPALFLKTQDSDTSLKANVTYTPTDDAMLYLQWAQGYRFGQPAARPPATVCDTNNDGLLDGTSAPVSPDDVRSDSVDSYELGGKFKLLNGGLVVNAAVYHVEWEDLPVRVTSPRPPAGCGFSVTQNAGTARSQGAELELTSRLTDNLRISLGATYIDAEFTETFAGLGKEGDRLPGSPEYSANLGAQYDFSVGSFPSFVSTDFTRVGTFHGDAAGLLPELGGYGALGLRVGTTINRTSILLYGTNLTNEDEKLVAAISPTRAWRLQPRTIGLTVGYMF